MDSIPICGEERTRLQHYTIFLLAGIPTMVIFGLVNLCCGNHLLCVLIFLSGAGLLTGLFVLRNGRDARIVYRINIAFFGFLIIFMLMLGGEDGSKILWMYTFPLIAFFLFGKGEGLIWSAIILLATLILFWGPVQSLALYPYASEFKIRFITTYLIVSSITYWFEYSRYNYRLGIEEKNRNLEEEKDRLRFEINNRERLEKELRRLASTDPLTGAANRRHFMEMVGREFDRFRRHRHGMALAMMDIDHFKMVNDTHGHPVGDEVLQLLVKKSHTFLRTSDLIGRLGGEEFGVLLVETNLEGANLVAERLCRKISKVRLSVDGGEVAITVSIGIANVSEDDESLESIMKRADKALYLAKARGRNRVVCL
ncbi:MAG: GGDEF domain-containing protein [Desulforhopalus sp.]